MKRIITTVFATVMLLSICSPKVFALDNDTLLVEDIIYRNCYKC